MSHVKQATPEGAAGSAADNKDAKGVWKGGTWTVVWARKLNLANPDDKALREGRAYNFSLTVGFGAKADIQATKLK